MDLQTSCEILEKLSDEDAIRNFPKLSTSEFMAVQIVLLELQTKGSYKLPEKYSKNI